MQYIQFQSQLTSDISTPVSGSINLFVDSSTNIIKVKDENGNLTGGPSTVETIYSDLSASWSGGNLIPGQYYKITDYQTCYDQPNFESNGNSITIGNYKSGSIEPLVVLATSTSSLSPYVHSTMYPKDTIKYDINFNQTEVTNGLAKGRIYERIDEVGNRTDYDWRSVQFKRYDAFYAQSTCTGKVSLTATATTASVIGVDTNFDGQFSIGSVLGIYSQYNNINGGFDFYEIVNISGSNYMDVTGSYYNEISDTYYSDASSYEGASPFQTNTVSVNKNSYEFYTFDTEGTPAQNGWYNNYLGDNIEYDTFILSNNVFRGGNYKENYFDSNVVGNTFDDDNTNNKCGSNFKYNTITNDFDNNTIGSYFEHNHIRCDFQNNIINDNFYSNMITDDDGIDFNYNIINGDYFGHNWFTGYNSFINNIINDNFYDNVIYRGFANNLINNNVNNNFFEGNVDNNQIKGNFNTNKIYDNFNNNVLNYFSDNIMLSTFQGNQINGQSYSTVLSGSFFDNTVGGEFISNTFRGNTGYNQIGSNFQNNTLGDSFGVGYGFPRANKIGNNVSGNTIGEYFYSNTISDNFTNNIIGDYFQQNTVLANNVNTIDFNTYYGNINTFTIINPNVGGSDGVYQLIPTTTNGRGIDATFDVTITSGSASVSIANVGKLYDTEDTLIITGSLIGGGTNLEIDVDTVTPTPMVYGNYDTTIQKASNGDVVLSVILPGEGYYNYITQNITQALPL